MKKFDEFTYIFLVNASQMAYLEDAGKTHAMLQQFNELYRYMIKSDGTALLIEELKAFKIYMDIQSSRYEGRFSFNFENRISNNDINVRHLSLLDFADGIMNDALTRFEGFFKITFKLNMQGAPCITASLESGDLKENHSIFISKE